jgi:hypothetical protein
MAAKLKAEEDAKRKATQEAERLAQEEARRKIALEAERKVAEQARQQAELEAQRKLEAEAAKKAALEAERKAAEEAKQKAELATKQKTEELMRQKAELEAKREAEERARKQAILEARKRAETAAIAEAARRGQLQAEQAAALKDQQEAQRQAEESARRSTAIQATQMASAAVSSPPAADKDYSGRQILDEISARHDRPYEYEFQQMILEDKRGNREERTLKRYLREDEKDEKRIASVFHSPRGVEGVALLTWQHAKSADDQWLFLPAQGKKMKRIAKGGKKNYFMGTDFTYEDLMSESRDKFQYDRLADEDLEGIAHFVVKATPTDPEMIEESGYAHRVIWVKKQNFVVARVDFFDKRERLIKRQTSEEYQQVQDNAWRADKTIMENLKKSHKTIIVIKERSFDEGTVPSDNFKQRTIESGRILR